MTDRRRIGQTREEAFNALPYSAQREVRNVELQHRLGDLEQQACAFIRSTPAATWDDPKFQQARIQAERDPLAKTVTIEINGKQYMAVGLPGGEPMVALVGDAPRLPTLLGRSRDGTKYSHPKR